MEAMKESVAQLSQLFQQKLTEFEERQQKLISPTTPGVSTLDAEFATFKEFTLNSIRALQKQLDLLAQDTDNLEMYTRRKILLLHGVPEQNKEDTAAIISNTMTDKLKLTDFQAKDIKRCHRMGKPSSTGKPRPILFKVRDESLRAKIWSVKTNLKGSGITMSEFLTKARHDVFMAARQRFGVNKAWTRDGYVYIMDKAGKRHRVNNAVDLAKLATQPDPASVVTQPAAVIVKETAPSKSKRSAAKK